MGRLGVGDVARDEKEILWGANDLGKMKKKWYLEPGLGINL